MRQIALDTETTGLSTADGHRIIEIGCVEIISRKITGNRFHYYLNPGREIDKDAILVHGITEEFLKGKPTFSEVLEEFLAFVSDAELIIHNAAFDVGFLNYEIALLKQDKREITHYCKVFDTLNYARKKHPGQQNNLDALCRRYGIDNSNRNLHGALLDANLLAELYLVMTGGQTTLFSGELTQDQKTTVVSNPSAELMRSQKITTRVIYASSDEIEAHNDKLVEVKKASQGTCYWPDQNDN